MKSRLAPRAAQLLSTVVLVFGVLTGVGAMAASGGPAASASSPGAAPTTSASPAGYWMADPTAASSPKERPRSRARWVPPR